ncbi:hypothetical protein CNR22_03430 [Sphingobacteriaceae bacterium]|nr:hypothetical protein CNR22_03430 [Sphingobacteriaceae bacterium]
MVFAEFRIAFSFLLLVLGFIQPLSVYAQCSFNGLASNYCVYSPTSQLTSTLAGGVYSGPGVTGSVFNPSVAGAGTHTISYVLCPSSYTITSGTYAPYTASSGTASSSGSLSAEGTTVSLSDDQMTSTAAAIGFNFKFFCATYTSFYISSNGFISFSASQSNGCCSGGTLPSTLTPLNIITATWTDWNPGAGGTISYTTVGTSPNRKLIVSYVNIPHFGSGGGNLTAQIHLYETSNVIEVHTASMVPNNYNHTMGIKDVTGTHGGAVSGRNSTSTWTAVAEMYRYTPIPGCASTRTTYVSPSSIPVSGNMSVCLGGSAALTGGGNVTYTWSTGSNSASINVTPSTTAAYSVSGTNVFGCVANSAVTVTVNTVGPTVTAVASNTANGICPGTTLSLNASGAISYTWSNGVANATAFSPTLSDTFTVTGANGCGSATAAVTVSIHPLPVVSAAASSPSVCSGNTLSLSGAGASTYTWFPQVLNAAPFTPAVSANYTVFGTSAMGCTAMATSSITVYPTPSVAPLSSPALICIGGSSSLTTSGALTYTWLPINSSGSLAIVSPTATTTYSVVQSNAHCSRTRTLTVAVNQLPTIAALVNPTLVCAQNVATLAAAGAQTYTWTAPGYTTYGASPVILPSVSTTYTLSASDGTCINSTTVGIAVNPNPVLTIAANNSVICAGDTSVLTVSGALSYSWNPAVSLNSTAVVSPTTATNYLVTGINSLGCTSIMGQVILVNAQPTVIAITNKTLVCVGGSATLTASGSANSYTWSGGQTSATTIVNPLATSIYSVTGQNTITGCKKTNTVVVTIFTPVLSISATSSICTGGTALLTSSGALTYTWSNGSNLNSATVSPVTALVYTLSATSNSNGLHCASTATASVGIYSNPTVTVHSNKSILCKGEKAILTGSGAQTYTWSNTASGATLQVSPMAQTIYTVTGTDSNGCVNTGTVLLKISVCAGIGQLNRDTGVLTIYPNPNNGEFTVQSQADLDLRLVNELGQVVNFIKLSDSNEHKTHLTDIANGIYFIMGNKDNQMISQKIIIMK